jgi:hypothetical protein
MVLDILKHRAQGPEAEKVAPAKYLWRAPNTLDQGRLG